MSSAAANDGAYDNVHRAFLQAFMARQSMTYDAARDLLTIIRNTQDPELNLRPERITYDDLYYYVGAINENISPFDMSIKSTRDQRSGEEILAFVNLTSDQLSQMATSHSADEIAYIRRLLDAMFETFNTKEAEVMALTGIQAINLARTRNEDRRDSGNASTSATASLTKPQAEHLLTSMVEEGWFEKSRKGFYSLSPRALMELKEWLFDTYNDEEVDEDDGEERRVKICAACKDIITVGQRCRDRNCAGRLHELCVEKMFRAQGNRQICPVCNTEWNEPLPVGEKAARATTNGNRSSFVPRTSDALMRDVDD